MKIKKEDMLEIKKNMFGLGFKQTLKKYDLTKEELLEIAKKYYGIKTQYQFNVVRRKNRDNCRWTEKEIEYLNHNILTKTLEDMALHLKRSVEGVKHKLYREFQTTSAVNFENCVTIPQLATSLNINRSIVKYWIDRYELPASKKTFDSQTFHYVIKINDFWEWLKENRENINLNTTKIKRRCLLPEPEWFIEDWENQAVYISKQGRINWSKEEEDFLKYIYMNSSYTVREIQDILNKKFKKKRNYSSVKQKLFRINKKVRKT